MSHGEKQTYPRLADVLGFCSPEAVESVAEAVLTVQRDHGDRSNRKHARLKYTIEDHGLDWFREQVNRLLREPLLPPRPFHFSSNSDRFGWTESHDGLWHLTVPILTGRIADRKDMRLRSALHAIATLGWGEFRVTPNQNLIVAQLEAGQQRQVQDLLVEYGVAFDPAVRPLRLHALSCVALPTCGLAMAEAERYLPEFVIKVERMLDNAGLAEEPIRLRITGCPNGCARPYLAEIGLVGKALGRYNLYLGGSQQGNRLNTLVGEGLTEEQILAFLEPLVQRFARERKAGEPFGDFTLRIGAARTSNDGALFHTVHTMAGSSR